MVSEVDGCALDSSGRAAMAAPRIIRRSKLRLICEFLIVVFLSKTVCRWADAETPALSVNEP
jgi:hypothetical protein